MILEVFLYSAVARPGNSGGPVISSRGHVVGIVSEQLSEQQSTSDQPFYAGVSSAEILRALGELDPGIQFPWETYE
jgi:S1-C subfamily serine protease